MAGSRKTGRHVAVLKKRYVLAFLCGDKSIETRLLRNRSEPWGKVRLGDEVFLKISSGPIAAVGVVSRIEYHEGLTPCSLSQLYNKHKHAISDDGSGSSYWQSKSDARYAVLIWLKAVREAKEDEVNSIELPKLNGRAWVVL